MGVFVYLCVCVCFFFFLSKCIFDLSVWMCLCASEEKEEYEKLLSLLSPEKREKKRSEWKLVK